jgi:hypothetical protein
MIAASERNAVKFELSGEEKGDAPEGRNLLLKIGKQKKRKLLLRRGKAKKCYCFKKFLLYHRN